jgi:uncharacterized protein involved in exopolysaccharide biosynthesis
MSAALTPEEQAGADADLFDYAKLRDYLGFAFGAVRRRYLVSLGTLAGIIALAVVALFALPKSYSCEIKIQAQRNQVISTLVGFNRQYDWDTPTRAAYDLVLRHDNLVSLVQKADLVTDWEVNRAPALQLRDWILSRVRKPKELAQSEKEEIVASILEKRLNVVPGDGTVTIEVSWTDARTAYRLIQSAYENFLQARQFEETSAVAEAIGLLEQRAANTRERANIAAERLTRLRAAHPRRVTGKVPAPVVAVEVLKPTDPELQQIRGQIRSKRQAIAEMEEYRRRRISELESKLTELKQVYNDAHPAVVDLADSIRLLRHQSSPQLAGLMQELEKLEEEYARRGGDAAHESAIGQTSAQLPAETVRLGQALNDEVESPEIEQAKSDLRYELTKFSAVSERIDSALLERDTQRAAFRYRYSVLRPPAFPTSPDKPKPVLVLAAGIIAGLFLALAAATMADVRRGAIEERWQVERALGLPVLAEVHES